MRHMAIKDSTRSSAPLRDIATPTTRDSAARKQWNGPDAELPQHDLSPRLVAKMAAEPALTTIFHDNHRPTRRRQPEKTMPIFNHNHSLGQATDLLSFINQAPVASIAPLPHLFGKFSALEVGETALVALGPTPCIIKAVDLKLNACAIYTIASPWPATRAFIHNVNGGHLEADDVALALGKLGNPPAASLCVVFAHCGHHDAGFQASLKVMIHAGIEHAHIVAIPNLMTTEFGIDHCGRIG